MNYIKIFIFRNNFSHSLKNIYGLICLSLCILMHFTFLLSLWHMLSLAYIFFLTFDAIFDSIWHKLYYQHKIWSWRWKKKSKTTSFGLQRWQQKVISRKWLKLAKIWKILLFVLNFNAPNAVRSSWNWSVLLYWL